MERHEKHEAIQQAIRDLRPDADECEEIVCALLGAFEKRYEESMPRVLEAFDLLMQELKRQYAPGAKPDEMDLARDYRDQVSA